MDRARAGWTSARAADRRPSGQPHLLPGLRRLAGPAVAGAVRGADRPGLRPDALDRTPAGRAPRAGGRARPMTTWPLLDPGIVIWPLLLGLGVFLIISSQPLGRPRPDLGERLRRLDVDERLRMHARLAE